MRRGVAILLLALLLALTLAHAPIAESSGFRLVYSSGEMAVYTNAMAVFERLVDGEYRPYALLVTADTHGTSVSVTVVDLVSGSKMPYNNVYRYAIGGLDAVWLPGQQKVITLPATGRYGVMEAPSLDLYAVPGSTVNSYNHADQGAVIVMKASQSRTDYRVYSVYTSDEPAREVWVKLSTLKNACGGTAPSYGGTGSLYPAMTDGSVVVELARVAGEAAVVTVHLDDGQVECRKLGVEARPGRTIDPMSGTVGGFADAAWPYLVVYNDGALGVYEYGRGWRSIPVQADDGVLRLHPSSVAVIGWLDGDTPVLTLVYLDSGTVKTIRLDGYRTAYPVIAVGYYAGQPIIAVGVSGRVVIVSLTGEILADLELDKVDTVKVVDIDSATTGTYLLVRGNTAGGAPVYEIYELESRMGLRVEATPASGRVYTGTPITVDVSVTDILGTPSRGR